MKKHLLALTLLTPFTTSATGLHISPEIKMGPYLDAGLSGGGLQLGMTDVLGLDAMYLSYSHTSAEILWDKDRLKTYRIGGQYHFMEQPIKFGLQLEAGLVEYEGSRDNIFSNETRYAEGTGASFSAAWVVFPTDNIGFRLGGDFNYIDKKKTLLENNWSATLSTGVIFHF
ncbi:hypothetical protein HOO69_01875 [Vibrio europaeus]|uniref:Outer membrane protein beta-barrel domain-containing protein n=1 Tax=Vibrio europaeus TaxID=300876 RepID=A0AAE7DVM4_9VIBR|nr:hypothetical protein [Vibrio europaeus]QJY35423.1 hypothetical protein HOO69_01875 [Vibrio europaeus]